MVKTNAKQDKDFLNHRYVVKSKNPRSSYFRHGWKTPDLMAKPLVRNFWSASSMELLLGAQQTKAARMTQQTQRSSKVENSLRHRHWTTRRAKTDRVRRMHQYLSSLEIYQHNKLWADLRLSNEQKILN